MSGPVELMHSTDSQSASRSHTMHGEKTASIAELESSQKSLRGSKQRKHQLPSA